MTCRPRSALLAHEVCGLAQPDFGLRFAPRGATVRERDEFRYDELEQKMHSAEAAGVVQYSETQAAATEPRS